MRKVYGHKSTFYPSVMSTANQKNVPGILLVSCINNNKGNNQHQQHAQEEENVCYFFKYYIIAFSQCRIGKECRDNKEQRVKAKKFISISLQICFHYSKQSYYCNAHANHGCRAAKYVMRYLTAFIVLLKNLHRLYIITK